MSIIVMISSDLEVLMESPRNRFIPLFLTEQLVILEQLSEYAHVEVLLIRGNSKFRGESELSSRRPDGVICHCIISGVGRVVVVDFPGILLVNMVFDVPDCHSLIDPA